jgi:hypothetical protein
VGIQGLEVFQLVFGHLLKGQDLLFELLELLLAVG